MSERLVRRVADLERQRGPRFTVPAEDAAPETLTFLQVLYLFAMYPDMPEDRAPAFGGKPYDGSADDPAERNAMLEALSDDVLVLVADTLAILLDEPE